jgi:hypothetical protein
MCGNDNDCASGTYCSAGTCVAKKMNGDACSASAPNQCAFGHCVDGVCCATACTGACVSCALPNSKGTCMAVDPNAADPHGVCHDMGAASCQTNGLCDGAGACQSYAPTTVCAPEACPAGTSTHTKAGTCATGSCAADSEPCDPYMCGAGGKCAGGCSGDTECVPGNYCASGHCVAKKAQGSMCGADNECGTGNCVENVCCGSANCGQCESCALPDSLGTCTMVPGGTTDPTGMCVDQGSIGCGTTGKCDDFGACAFQSGKVVCAAATCSSASELTPTRYCDGSGHCAAGNATDCSPFACDPSVPACFESCTDPAQCSDGNTCDENMSCVPVTP